MADLTLQTGRCIVGFVAGRAERSPPTEALRGLPFGEALSVKPKR